MKKNRKRKLSYSALTGVLVAAGVALLAFAGAGSARAALSYFSQAYSVQVSMQNIGVSLLERGAQDEEARIVSWRNYDPVESSGEWDEQVPGSLLDNMLADGEELVLEHEYPEELSVRNTGTINSYVRISIYRYWKNQDGDKQTLLSPDLISLTLDGKDLYDDSITSYGKWIKDPDASSDERVVLYYTDLLPAGETTSLVTDHLKISNLTAKSVQQETVDGTIITSYTYDDADFCIEAQTDALQEHNAEDAARSAWGRDLTVSNNTLRLK